MNKLKKLVGSTKFHVYLGNPAKSQPIEIQQDGNTYYRIELNEKFRVGSIYDLVKLLQKFDAQLAVKKGNRFKPYQLLVDKNVALMLLKDGFSIISVENLSTLSFDEEYRHIVASNNKTYDIGSIPSGLYCIAFNEPRLSRTFAQVKVEQERIEKVKRDEERRRMYEEKIAEATENDKRKDEVDRTQLEKDNMNHLSVIQNDSQPKEKYSNWKKLGWIGLGVAVTMAVQYALDKISPSLKNKAAVL